MATIVEELGVTTDELVRVSSNDTIAKYLEDAIVVSNGVNSTSALEISTLNDGLDEDLQIQFDETKITITESQISDLQSYLLASDIDTFLELDTIVADKSLVNLNDGGTFLSDISVPDEAYGVAWNGSVEVPTKNAIYDHIESLALGATQLNELTDVNTSTPTNRNVLVADGVDWESRALVEADISDLGNYSLVGHTHVLTDITDVTATATEVNLLDLAGLTVGWALLADSPTTASWQALPAGSDELIKVSSNDTTAKYLEDAIVASEGSNTTSILEITTLNDGADEDLQLQIDETKISITESQISDLQSYSLVGHTHLLADVTDVTATAAEVNLLDLAGLTAGWALLADSPTTASWQALPAAGDPDQNLWETVTANSGSTTANTTTDSLGIMGVSPISTAIVGDTLSIYWVDLVDKWYTISTDSGNVSPNATADTLSIEGGTGIDTSGVDATDTVTVTLNAVMNELSDVAPHTHTKGKILVSDGTDWEALSVGTNDHVLTADSAEATGVKWAAGGADGYIGDTGGEHVAGDSLDMNGHDIIFEDGTGIRSEPEDDYIVTFTGSAGANSYLNISNGIGGVTVSALGTNAGLALNGTGTGNIWLGSWWLDGDQAPAAGQDNYVLTWDNSASLAQFEAIPYQLSFGADQQIPFMNAGGTDFDYDSALKYDDTNQRLYLGDGAGTPNIRIDKDGFNQGGIEFYNDSAIHSAIYLDSGERMVIEANQTAGLIVYPNSFNPTNIELNGFLNSYGATTAGVGVLRLNDVNTTPAGTLTSGGLLYVSGTSLYFHDDAGTATDLTAAGGADGYIGDVTTHLAGGTLDMNGNVITFDTTDGIYDDSLNEHLIFIKTASAVNYLEITNAATATAPKLKAAGDNATVNLWLEAKGATGVIDVWSKIFMEDQNIHFEDGFGLEDGSETLALAIQDVAGVDYWEIENGTGTTTLNAIGNSTNVDASIQPKGTGNIVLGNYTLDGDQTVGAGQDNYVLKYDNSSGLISLEADETGGGGGFTWNEVTGTSQSAAVNNGYICNNAALVTVTIPTTAAVGDVVRVAGSGAGGWKVAQNASESINFGNKVTTTGTGGSLASVNRYDAVELICITANTTWAVLSSVGNITIV